MYAAPTVPAGSEDGPLIERAGKERMVTEPVTMLGVLFAGVLSPAGSDQLAAILGGAFTVANVTG